MAKEWHFNSQLKRNWHKTKWLASFYHHSALYKYRCFSYSFNLKAYCKAKEICPTWSYNLWDFLTCENLLPVAILFSGFIKNFWLWIESKRDAALTSLWCTQWRTVGVSCLWSHVLIQDDWCRWYRNNRQPSVSEGITLCSLCTWYRSTWQYLDQRKKSPAKETKTRFLNTSNFYLYFSKLLSLSLSYLGLINNPASLSSFFIKLI